MRSGDNGGVLDDLGADVALDSPPGRVVSLVPSLTEAIAVTAPGVLVGATNWCTHPAGLDVARVRGTKNPDRAAIAALRARGETVISDLPGTECQPDEFACELQLVEIAGEWIVQHT